MNHLYRGYDVQMVDAPAKYFIGYRETLDMDQMSSENFAQHLPKVFAAVQAAKIDMDGMPCGLFFLWDETNRKVDLAYAIPVKNKAEVEGFSAFEIPSGKRLVIDYYGPYDGTGNAHFAMDEYMAAHNLQAGTPVWEEYITDPTTTPDSSQWLTKVYYPVGEKQ